MSSIPPATIDDDADKKKELRRLLWSILVLFLVGLLPLSLYSIFGDFETGNWIIGNVLGLLSVSCTIAGFLVGFLFGIPRVLQFKQDLPQGQDSSQPKTSNSGSRNYQQIVNTNLEQISDWLTKIIVGLGLVHLRSLPGYIHEIGKYLSAGVLKNGNNQEVQTMIDALLVYFPIVGFLSGYLITRVYLSGVFRDADTDGIEVDGKEIGLTDVVRNLVNVVTDRLTSAPESKAETAAPKNGLRSILWVDDNPNNNAIERQALVNQGIEVTTALSTDDALKLLTSKEFDLIISDMGRTEGGVYNASAGVLLLRKINEMKMPHIRTIIYCAKRGAELYGADAKKLGADDVVFGPRALMKTIGV